MGDKPQLTQVNIVLDELAKQVPKDGMVLNWLINKLGKQNQKHVTELR